MTAILSILEDQFLTAAYTLGVTIDGDKKNADIIRRDLSGKVILVAVNMDDLQQDKKANSLTFQPGDILYVQTRSHAQTNGSILGTNGGLSALATFLHL